MLACAGQVDHTDWAPRLENVITMTLSGTAQFVFFGDSLSDDGNLFRVTEGLIDADFRLASTGYQGRVTDGPTFAEYVGPLSGMAESLNYAVAGAEASGRQTLLDYAQAAGETDEILVPLSDPALQFDMNLDAQIARFAADTAGENRGSATAFVLIGGNDYGGIDPGDVSGALADLAAVLLTTVNATLDAVRELDSLGVNEVIVSLLPPAAFLPAFAGLDPGTVDDIDTLIDQHNGLLETGVDLLAFFGADARVFDLSLIADAIVDDPTQFGILAPWDLTLRDGDPALLAAFDPAQVGFWDPIHPSAATHAVLGAWTAYSPRGVTLGDGDDLRTTGGGADVILAYGGNDTVISGGSGDLVFMGSGNDHATLKAGNDTASGGAGDDTLTGGFGRDVLSGGPGDDLLRGNAGSDVLIDGAGNDEFHGGKRADLFIFFEDAFLGGSDAGQNLFRGGGGSDRLILVLTEDTADAFEATGQTAALDALGITARSIESIEIARGRDALDGLVGAETWHDSADLWGLI